MCEENENAACSNEDEEGELIIIVGASESALTVLAYGEEVARVIPRSELGPEAIEFE